MEWDVIEVKAEPDFQLQVRFEDGTSGRVRFMPGAFRGVFTRLEDPAEFAKVGIEFGAVTWPGELDLAPDAMYDEIKASGEFVVQ